MNIIQNIIINESVDEPNIGIDILGAEFEESHQEPITYPCGICGETHLSTECNIIGIKHYIKDTPVLSKARLSLPCNLEVVTMAEGTCTIRALQSISEGTKFGPFQANKIFTLDPKINYPLKIFKNDEYFKEYYLNNSSENECNWMLFVQPASFSEEQNLMSYEDNSEIYFITIREVLVGEYLKVWYSPYSAKLMNKDALPSSQIEIPDNYEQLPDNKIININEIIKKQQKITNRKKWMCKYCGQQDVEVIEFALHMLQHYSTQLRKVCEYCSQAFQTKLKLKKHMFFVHNDEMYDQKNKMAKQHENSTFAIEQNKSEDAMVGGPLLMNNTDMLVQDMDISSYDLDSPNNMTLDPDNLTADNLLSVNENFNFHIAESEEKFVCDICLKNFTKLKFLVNHLHLHTGKFSCSKCSTVFGRNENLKGHSCNTPTLKCPHCEQMFGLKKFLTRHISYKHQNDFTCKDICKKVFSSVKTLTDHKCEPEKVLLSCNVCEKVFSSNRNLTRHRKIHKTQEEYQNKVRYVCEVCPKQYESKKAINQHLESHKEKQYSCLVCKKKFIRLSTFQDHMQLHKNIVPFECKECDQKFTLRKYLTLHMKVHSEPTFKCSQCDETFKQRSNMLTHFKRRHEKKCPDCNELFDSGEKLKQHSVLHYEKCFECPCCKHIVKLKSSLSRHLKKKHPDENINLHDIKEMTQRNISDNLENVDNNNINMDSDFDKNNCDDIAELFDLKDKDDSNTTTTLQDIEQNLDYIVNNYDANNLIHEANLLNPDNLLNGTNINHDTGLIIGLGDDNSLINDASHLMDDDFADITGNDKNIDEHVLDFNSLEMEFEKNFNMTPEVDFNNREVCLSMPELTDIDQNITLGENAYILENGNIIEPIEQGKVVLYILDKDGNKTT